MPVVERPCNCQSEFQDLTYGKNIRLFNTSKEGKEAHCTVCAKAIRLDGSDIKKK